MIDMWTYSGFQFGLIMLIVGLIAGSMMGYGIHKILIARHA